MWHEVYSADREKTLEFYKAVFGFEVQDGGEEFPGYKMLAKDGVGIAGAVQTGGPGMENTPPHWAIYIHVPDFEQAHAKCTELGAATLVPPMDVPQVGRMAMIQDPTGARFWLFRPEPR